MQPDYAAAVRGTRMRGRRLAALLAGTALAAALPRLAVPATLDLNGADTTLPQAGFFGNQSYVNGTDGATNNGGAAARLIEGGGPAGTTYSGVIQDGTSATGLVHTGGEVTLLSAQTYTGGTTITGGTLIRGSGGSLASTGAVTINAGGTLGLRGNQTIGDLSGAGTVDLTNGPPDFFNRNTLRVGTANSTTFAGNIVGITFFPGGTTTVGLIKQGSGTLTLTGQSSYNQPTVIDGGTLKAGAPGSLSGSPMTVAAGARLDLNNFDYQTTGLTGDGSVTLGSAKLTIAGLGLFGPVTSFGGVISGTGSVTLTAPQAIRAEHLFTGTNTYTGGTTIQNGASLRLGANDSPAGSIVGNVINNGDLVIDRSGTLMLDGVISGTGLLIKNGTGTLVLTNANTYSGETALRQGTLRLENSQALGSGTLSTFGLVAGQLNKLVVDYANGINVANPIALGISQLTPQTTQLQVLTGTATQSGVISETGGSVPVEKLGTGTLVLTGINTYSGPTTVSAGVLQVDGSIANSAVTVNSGAALTGSGTVGAVTVNSGATLAPGPSNAPGTMTIRGNLAFQSGALYIVQVNPTTASLANVTAGGTALFAGTVMAAFAPGSYLARQYTIVTSAGRSGTFGTLVTTGLPAGFAPSLSYTATDAVLNLTAGLGMTTAGQGLATTSLSTNQQAIATSLNNFFNNGGALPLNFLGVFGLTGSTLGTALSRLSGEVATGSERAAAQMMSDFLALMLDPYVEGRSGVGGADGRAFGFAPEREPQASPDIALAYASVLKAPAAKPAAFEQRWSLWGTAFGGYNHTDGDPVGVGSHDLAARTGGMAAGLDYRLTRDSIVGMAVAGGATGWSLANGLGSGNSDAFQAGLYGMTRFGPAYVAGALAYTAHWMTTDRFALGDHLTARFAPQSFGARLETGTRYALPLFGVTPYAAVQTQSFHIPRYAETDLSGLGFGLAYRAETATDTRGELGARFDRLTPLDNGAMLALRARAAWAHDWTSNPALTALFQSLPGASFVVNGATPVQDSALVSAGAELRLKSNVALAAKFDSQLAGRSQTYAGTATVRVAW